MRGYASGVAIASMMGLIGCGEDDTYVYDVTLDAAALSNVPNECSGQLKKNFEGEGPATGIEAQQQWRLQRGEMDSMTLEMPDLNIRAPGISGYSVDADDEPDIFHGSVGADGGFQFVQTKVTNFGFEWGANQAFSIVITSKHLDDTIQGHLWFRSEHLVAPPAADWDEAECVATIPFTGKRVKE
ncbi:hypothetical protein [Myxococcus sp. NMCA1]|uniref:hypothetical protein n=1 Tax=Myxococcus sp. NMCA1 TaxID=2996785 RepID=UPI00228595B6|nr:hypothetical protein [Myxococcus sp. NMCA1]WAM27163.1 hypothetical protein OZ403_03315 [Myxococcus sp. NMCA1]